MTKLARSPLKSPLERIAEELIGMRTELRELLERWDERDTRRLANKCTDCGASNPDIDGLCSLCRQHYADENKESNLKKDD